MDISIEKLHEADFEQLFEFELENRAYFEEMVPSRGNVYYNFDIFRKRNKALLDEQSQGLSHFYLIKNIDGLILGRMNLVDIEKSQGSGHIGYRVGKSHTGKGVAKKALGLLLETFTDLDLKQVKAKTTTNNIASKKVLEKNGFEQTESNGEEFEINGQVLKFVNYLWTNKILPQ
ncbi:GNAT family N-acetyltransferase [Virgibacillus phasianinus]|nr:GNAT family N-acetyltransferase [Virgibacillus phasianinus]